MTPRTGGSSRERLIRAAMGEAARRLGASGGTLVDYSTSGETSGDYKRVVGYAGMTIN